MIKDEEILQAFEYTVLCIISSESEIWPARLTKIMEEQLKRVVSLAQVYVSVQRLQSKDMITIEKSEITPVRGGRSRNLLSITQTGIDAMSRTKEFYQKW